VVILYSMMVALIFFVPFCRLMKAQALGDTSSLEFMRGRRILEINPDHPIVRDLNVKLFKSMLIVDLILNNCS
jgi:hypothetical protein